MSAEVKLNDQDIGLLFLLWPIYISLRKLTYLSMDVTMDEEIAQVAKFFNLKTSVVQYIYEYAKNILMTNVEYVKMEGERYCDGRSMAKKILDEYVEHAIKTYDTTDQQDYAFRTPAIYPKETWLKNLQSISKEQSLEELMKDYRFKVPHSTRTSEEMRQIFMEYLTTNTTLKDMGIKYKVSPERIRQMACKIIRHGTRLYQKLPLTLPGTKYVKCEHFFHIENKRKYVKEHPEFWTILANKL